MDAITRRAEPLQNTKSAADPTATMHSEVLKQFGLKSGDMVKLRQNNGEAILIAQADDKLPMGCVRVAAAHPKTGKLGAMFGEISVERAN